MELVTVLFAFRVGVRVGTTGVGVGAVVTPGVEIPLAVIIVLPLAIGLALAVLRRRIGAPLAPTPASPL